MASQDKDSGHLLVLATSRLKSEDNLIPSSGPPEGHMDTSSGQREGVMATSIGQPESHSSTSVSRGYLSVSEADTSSSDEEYFTAEDDSGSSRISSDGEHDGHLVPTGSAEHKGHEGHLVPGGSAEHEVPEPGSQAVTPSTCKQHSGNAQSANIINIVTGGAGQGTLGRDTLDLRTDEARKIFAPTEAYRKVKQILKEFGHVTICGASGEGKTTMALVLGSQYRQKGKDVSRYYRMDTDTDDRLEVRSQWMSRQVHHSWTVCQEPVPTQPSPRRPGSVGGGRFPAAESTVRHNISTDHLRRGWTVTKQQLSSPSIP